MKKMPKYLMHDQESKVEFIVIDNRVKSETPMFCPICEFVMNTSDDFDFYEEFSCCSECGMKFAQSRPDEWLSGWRPQPDEIEEIKKEIENRSLNLFLDDSDI